MRKRIHLHQLAIGMFVEEFEEAMPEDHHKTGGFLIKSTRDIEEIVESHAMNCVINVRKGVDVAGGTLLFRPADRARLEQQLLSNYSSKEIARAKTTMTTAAPQVRRLFLAAHEQSTIDTDCASDVVGELMSAADDNAGALINLLKLKDKDEGTFLHSLSVSVLMVTFGRALGLDEGMIRELGI